MKKYFSGDLRGNKIATQKFLKNLSFGIDFTHV